MFLSWLLGKNYTRQQLLKHTNSPVMKAYLESPFPSNNQLIIDADIVSLDFETTGLDINKDSIVSIGAVNVVKMGIELSSCYHQLIKPQHALTNTSVVIHNLTDNELKKGISITNALPELLKRLSGKVLLVHNAHIELGFLNKLCREFYETDFVIPVIDTQYLAKRTFDRQNLSYRSNELRLFNLCRKYNMPRYKAHHSMLDAIATAELFLAMANNISEKSTVRLKDCLS